jgi:hypothetical protein
VLHCFFVLVLGNAPFVKNSKKKNYHNSCAPLRGPTFLQPALSSKTSVKILVMHKTRRKIYKSCFKSLPKDCSPLEMNKLLRSNLLQLRTAGDGAGSPPGHAQHRVQNLTRGGCTLHLRFLLLGVELPFLFGLATHRAPPLGWPEGPLDRLQWVQKLQKSLVVLWHNDKVKMN